jgi:phage baseplate assembly protein W
MAANEAEDSYSSFLGSGWSFPPEFVRQTGEVRMSGGERDIEESLRILFSTRSGERLFEPRYGLDMHEVLFEPMSTTLRAFLAERIKIAVLIYEPRINVLALGVESPDPHDGTLRISLDYEIRATNARYNLVFPFYLHDGNEANAAVGVPRP